MKQIHQPNMAQPHSSFGDLLAQAAAFLRYSKPQRVPALNNSQGTKSTSAKKRTMKNSFEWKHLGTVDPVEMI